MNKLGMDGSIVGCICYGWIVVFQMDKIKRLILHRKRKDRPNTEQNWNKITQLHF